VGQLTVSETLDAILWGGRLLRDAATEYGACELVAFVGHGAKHATFAIEPGAGPVQAMGQWRACWAEWAPHAWNSAVTLDLLLDPDRARQDAPLGGTPGEVSLGA